MRVWLQIREFHLAIVEREAAIYQKKNANSKQCTVCLLDLLHEERICMWYGYQLYF